MSTSARKVVPFNPFIVLSDVTISTLVIIACLLMIFSVATATVEKDKQNRLNAISKNQEKLKDLMVRVKARATENNIGASCAGGDTEFLVRFSGDGLFERTTKGTASDPLTGGIGASLSDKGRHLLGFWAQTFADELGKQCQPANSDINGTLIEIQVRGHCAEPRRLWGQPSQEQQEMLLQTSVLRSLEVASVFEPTREQGFPYCLISVAGLGAFRPAYKSTEETVSDALPANERVDKEARRRKLEALRKDGKRKASLENRIDILLKYSGGKNQDYYVQAKDGDRKIGPWNDTSSPDLAETEKH